MNFGVDACVCLLVCKGDFELIFFLCNNCAPEIRAIKLRFHLVKCSSRSWWWSTIRIRIRLQRYISFLRSTGSALFYLRLQLNPDPLFSDLLINNHYIRMKYDMQANMRCSLFRMSLATVTGTKSTANWRVEWNEFDAIQWNDVKKVDLLMKFLFFLSLEFWHRK